MLNKFKGLFLLLFILLVLFTSCDMVSAHEGDMPPEIDFVTPQNNQTVSGNVNLGVALDHSHTGTPNALNITITGINVNYNKKIKLSQSNFNSANQRWQSSWDTSDAPNGKYSIKAECRDIYGGGSATINVTVNNVKKATKIELNNFKGVNNRDIIIVATLKDSSNVPLSGKNIQFTVGAKTYVAMTDNGGMARITHKGPIGTYSITTKFLGDSNYAISEKTSTLTITSNGNILKVTSVSIDKGKVTQLKATLTNSENNQPSPGQTVRFTVNGIYVGQSTTNKEGITIFNYKVPLNGGKYTILAMSNDGMSGSGVLTVRQSGMFLKISTDNASPLVGNTITLYYRIVNDGPNTGTNTLFTYKMPKGFKFIKASKDAGKCTYNVKSRTISWKLPSAKVGTSLLKVTVKVGNSGKFLLRPKVTTDTYDKGLQSSLSNIYLRTNADLTISKVKRSGNIYKITIKNIGGLSSESSHMRISYKVGKKTISKTYRIKGIDAGKSTIINAKFFKNSKNKKYIKTVYINYKKKVKEANYKNNKKQFK